jgi:hypothetical protein
MAIEVDRQAVQISAILGITALGVAAIAIGGDLALVVVTAVAAAMGGVIGWLFPSPMQGGNSGYKDD